LAVGLDMAFGDIEDRGDLVRRKPFDSQKMPVSEGGGAGIESHRARNIGARGSPRKAAPRGTPMALAGIIYYSGLEGPRLRRRPRRPRRPGAPAGAFARDSGVGSIGGHDPAVDQRQAHRLSRR